MFTASRPEAQRGAMTYRIFFAAGPGDVIQAHEHWMADQHDPTQVSITFSSQFEEFCREIDAEAYIVSYCEKKRFFQDGPFILEHRPKPMPGAAGARYHIREILYGLGLLATAVRFRADAAVLDSGSTHYFVMSLFRLAGIRVVTVLHNTLWPRGFPPTRAVPRLIAQLDSLFFRWASTATIGVSPECIRQVEQLTQGRHKAVYEIRAQFRREHFEKIHPPPSHDVRPFRIMFIGRINRTKGVFDVLAMAQKVEARAPGRVRWELCGSGPDLAELKRQHHEMGLGPIVSIRGWTSPAELRDVYTRSHASIVPTRSSFIEGLAMTAAEAILVGRPVITNPVVPALELLRPACVEARTDDVDSYVDAIMKLIDDQNSYRLLCEACPGLRRQFYDREQGLKAILGKVITPKRRKVLKTP
jgi:glycogen synthase